MGGPERDRDAERWGESLGNSCWRVKLGTWVRPPPPPQPTPAPRVPAPPPRPGLYLSPGPGPGSAGPSQAGQGLGSQRRQQLPHQHRGQHLQERGAWALLGAQRVPGGPGAASRDTDLGVRAQRHVVMAKVALVLPVKPYGLQEGEGGWGLTALQDWGMKLLGTPSSLLLPLPGSLWPQEEALRLSARSPTPRSHPPPDLCTRSALHGEHRPPRPSLAHKEPLYTRCGNEHPQQAVTDQAKL